ncbi:hypothetical protein Tco_1430581 [Tanacetum coccineum]
MTTALSIENGSSIEGRVLFKFNVWVPIGKCNRVLERQKKLRNQIFRALTESADVPSRVTETTDTTSTLQLPRSPLQNYSSSRYLVGALVRFYKTQLVSTGKKKRCDDAFYVNQTCTSIRIDGSFKDGDGDGDTQWSMASANYVSFFTSAQDGNRLLDDERLSLADDLKKAHDHNQNKSK